jgi:hypothetical protein
MIEVVERKDEEAKKLFLKVRPQHLKEGVIKLSPGRVEEVLDQLGIVRGKCLSSQTVCNKPNFPKEYEFVYELPQPKKKVVKKVIEKVDKSTESVTLEKATTRKKKFGG